MSGLLWKVYRWVMPSFWRYLLAPRNKSYTDRRDWPRIIWCRLRGHPAGVHWYNSGGYEPDMHCRGCEDDLG